MSLTVKAYLEGGKEPEIRRFVVDHGVSSSFEYFSQKVAHVFPSLSGKTFRLFWKDCDDDYIAFDSDEELVQALGCLTADIFKVFVRVTKNPGGDQTQPQGGNGIHHPGVTCDGCDSDIYGNRYKCEQCPDYDLCEGCKTRNIHPEHTFVCISHPFWSMFGHHGYRGGHQGGHHGWGHHGWGRGAWFGGPSAWTGGCRGKKRCSNGKSGWFKKWWEEQMAAGNESQPSTSQEGEKPAEGASAQCPFTGNVPKDFLKNVGEQVAAMLDPLGIDVEVDVEHHGERERCGEQKKKEKRAAGSEEKTATTTESEAGVSNSDAKTPDSAVEMEQTANPGENMGSSADGSSGEDDWTMVNDHDKTSGGVAKKKQQAAKPVSGANLYPDLPPVEPHISQAREQMLAMGFHDEAGWLTRLLISTNGDIFKALDAVRPNKSN